MPTPTTYSEIEVSVDGTKEETATFTDYLLEEQYIEQIRQEAKDDGYVREVQILRHDHSPGGACNCQHFTFPSDD
jgi:hypothetical protein